ncbi:MAG: VCBS repeat-containing protein [Planctomycetes bacterium]|nr:VCBS repeat-containing protein [Planctomycetota bacterium]MBI3834438.1 VCBS repeat-containing protein [Planctomycetota bacterium]
MKITGRNWFWTGVTILALGVGCGTVVRYVGDQTGGGGGGGGGSTGIGSLDSSFSNDPLSPGGTGGTQPPDPNTGDVELPSQDTKSFFTAFQIDPVPEDTAGPKFVAAADIDQDGLIDLVSAWNQSQSIQIHLQRRDPSGVISFRTITLAGTTPIAIVAGLAIGNINGDAFPDIVVLVKASGLATFCPSCSGDPQALGELDGRILIYFNPANPGLIPDGDNWREMALENPFVSNRNATGHVQFPGAPTKDIETSKEKPEWSGFTSLAVANIDGQPGDDIVVALNPAQCNTFGQQPPLNTVDLWVNPGPGLAETASNWGIKDPSISPNRTGAGVPLTVMADAPNVKDIAVYDVDGDGDLDIVATFPSSMSLNVRWARNPLLEQGTAAVTSGLDDGIGNVCQGGFNDGAPCPNGDECLGLPGTADDGCCTPTSWHLLVNRWEVRPIGQIDTDADVLALADIDSDGFTDIAVRSTNGKLVQWFRRPNQLVVAPEFPPGGPTPNRFDFPWDVFTLTEFTDQEPEAIAFGDVTGDGQPELLVAVNGGVYWYDGTLNKTTIYDPWVGTTIIQDNPPPTTNGGTSSSGSSSSDSNSSSDGTLQGGTGVGVNATDVSTVINRLLAVDLDGDGKIDVIGTLDRRSGSGLSDDRIVWYRNTKTTN